MRPGSRLKADGQTVRELEGWVDRLKGALVSVRRRSNAALGLAGAALLLEVFRWLASG